VPQNKDLKRLVRARMAETSENYTQALTALLGETRLDPLPDGWFIAGSSPAQYDAGLLPRTCAYEGRRVIRLRFRAAAPPGGFGTVMQSFDAARYRGRRVRFTAMIRGQEITDWAGAWLRVDAADRARAFDNMDDRPLRGSTDWTEAANVLDVGEDASSVHFGVLLAGAGAVDLARPRFELSAPMFLSPGSRAVRWRPALRALTSAPSDPDCLGARRRAAGRRGAVDLAGPRFEVVGTDVSVTRIPRRPLAAGPQGLDFGAV